TTQYGFRLQQFVQDILVSNVGARQLDVTFPQRDFQTKISHHGRDDQPLVKFATGVQIIRQDPHRCVTVNELSPLINEQCPVSISVESDPQIGPVSDDTFPQFINM